MAYKLIRLVVLFLIPLGSWSQLHKICNVGDTMPPMTFKNIFNKPESSISLNEYKGKLIILDFWNRWCGSCIEAFPKMEKLQQEFGDKIKILLVTTDNNKDLSELFKRVKQPALPIISNDTILSNMFPHRIVPHHIWINPDGRVQFITEGYNATTQNVAKVLEGKAIKLTPKSDLRDVDEDADLWKEGNGRFQKYIKSYSFGMANLEEIGSTGYSFTRDSTTNTCSFKFINIPLLGFYKIAFVGSIHYEDKEFAQNNRIWFNVTGGFKRFEYPVDTDSMPGWEKRNLICYESKWPMTDEITAYQYLQNDANRFFPYSVKVETKEMDCFILKKLNDFSNTKTVNKEKLHKYTDSSISFKNMPISALLYSLNDLIFFKNAPVVDETNFSSNINIELLNAFKDIEILKTQLLTQGLLLEQGKRKLRMLVISDKI